jgi:Rod binding domain-containing protein
MTVLAPPTSFADGRTGTLPPRTASARQAQTPEAAGKQFEALVVGQMLESMFQGIDTGGTFGGGQAERTWRSFMLQEYGTAIAQSGTFGIGSMLQADISRLYAAQTADGTP